MSEVTSESSKIPSCDAYFEAIQSRKKLPPTLQESLTAAFGRIPVSSFPEVAGGKVIEVSSETSIIDAVRTLSEHNILAAPVRNSDASAIDWRSRYLGVIDYSAIILWVLENAELAALGLSAGSATIAGLGAGAIGALGAVAAGATGPAAMAGLTVAAAGAALAGGAATDTSVGKDAPAAADNLGDDFYKLLIKEEPFKSTTVRSIIESYRWSPFLPVSPDSTMLTVLLLLSKYRLRNVPVIESEKGYVKNFITQSAIIQGLQKCKGRDWFDCISARPLSDLGLPFMSSNEVISVKGDDLILEAFKRMKDNRIGGVPVVEGSSKKLIASVSIRDIRFLLLMPSLFSNFRHLTVNDFISLKDSMNKQDEKPMASPVSCAPSASLGSVIDILAWKCTHRIYVVEGGEREVVGVVTLRDVISCFIFEPPGYFDNYFGMFDGSVKEILKQ